MSWGSFVTMVCGALLVCGAEDERWQRLGLGLWLLGFIALWANHFDPRLDAICEAVACDIREGGE